MSPEKHWGSIAIEGGENGYSGTTGGIWPR